MTCCALTRTGVAGLCLAAWLAPALVDAQAPAPAAGKDYLEIPNGRPLDPAQVGFVEMLLPRNTAYVGEMIPVQIRVALNTRAPVESLGSGVQIATTLIVFAKNTAWFSTTT